MIWLRKWLIFHWLALTPYSRQGILLVYSWALHSVEMICFFCHRGILSFFPLGAGQFGPLTFYLSVFFFCYFPLPHELKIVIDYFMSSIATELIDFLCIDLVNILLDPHQHIWPSWGFCECCDFLVSILWTELLLDGPSDGCGLAKLVAGAPQFGPTITETLPTPAWFICSEESSVANATFFFTCFAAHQGFGLVCFSPLLVFGFLVFRTDGIWGMLRQLFHTYTR